ncbi:MAG: aldehyde ferredoxin oxidoreductase family protein [Planctomycetes bacterium]|nr:aldehyde ferredoxin oxidoreductase family protein [Planctomycetota bacterium]
MKIRTSKTTYAVINLTNGKIETGETPEKAVRAFLGGRGLNMYYLRKYLKPDTDPLSPENVLIFGTGLLTGTGIPNSGRFSVTSKSPESRVIADSNCGGFFGPEMRYAGIDRLILLGKADKPSYIYIEDGKIEIRDAAPYWGCETTETQLKLRKDLGNDVEIACIGTAGENLVRFACVRTGVKNAAGRGGLGCVMGYKNIKAVVVRGNFGMPIADTKNFHRKVVETRDLIYNSKITHVLGRVGTPLLYDVSNYLGAIRTKNSQLNQFEDSLNAEEIHKYVEKMVACHSCVVHCRHRNRVEQSIGEGPEYTSIVLVGANLGIANTQQVIDLSNLCNELGLDVSSAGTIIAWAIELFERGYLKKSDYGYEVKFGDYEKIRQLMLDIAARKGLGDVLAESTRLVDKFGKETGDFLIAVKGLPQSCPHDVRYIRSFALGLATASRGADHLRSRPTLEIFNLPKEFSRELYGTDVDPNPTTFNTKEHMVFMHENIYATIDCLGICKFVCHGFNSPHFLDYEHFVDLIKVTVGMNFTLDEIKEVGKRLINLERTLNMSFGMTRKDDTLPGRYFNDPMPLGRSKGNKIDKAEFEKALTRLYKLRGWTEEGTLNEKQVEELKSLGV